MRGNKHALQPRSAPPPLPKKRKLFHPCLANFVGCGSGNHAWKWNYGACRAGNNLLHKPFCCMRMILLLVISQGCHTPTHDLPAQCLNCTGKAHLAFKAPIRIADGLLYMIRADVQKRTNPSIEILQRCGTFRDGALNYWRGVRHRDVTDFSSAFSCRRRKINYQWTISVSTLSKWMCSWVAALAWDSERTGSGMLMLKLLLFISLWRWTLCYWFS